MAPSPFGSDFNITRRNAPRSFWNDLYHRLLRLRWRYLILSALATYLLINLVFSLIYFVLNDGLHPSGLSFSNCFFFSVHTFSTVGYGDVFPVSFICHIVTVIEIFTGLLSLSMMTGLFVAKFSRPTARFLFSQKMLVTQNFGRPALIFRLANTRSNRVMDAQVSLAALHSETSAEGIQYRRFDDLKLVRSQTPVFAMSLVGVHVIEPGGLAEQFLARLKQGENIELMVSVRGLDDTFGQTIHATRIYRASDIHWGGQFQDILEIHADGTRVIDFANFDKINES